MKYAGSESSPGASSHLLLSRQDVDLTRLWSATVSFVPSDPCVGTAPRRCETTEKSLQSQSGIKAHLSPALSDSPAIVNYHDR
jgi:hypothetical protein